MRCLSLLPLVLGTAAMAQPPTAGERPPSRLADSGSPYLLQHQHDPVDWYPWGPAAFAAARTADRPILLSIGYAACHWCHVMAKESFRDPELAQLLNEHFVCIKVDREQHPDVDELYLAALAAMGQDGGWPLTMFLLPDGKPFFGGTYFPPTDQGGRSGLRRVLEHLVRTWRERRPELERGATEFATELRAVLAPELPSGTPDAALLSAAVAALAEQCDAAAGGFGVAPGFAPKFPPAVELLFLLERSEPRAQELVERTLRALAEGALCDPLGGGFHRYATDRQWRSVHFEKMLYDNAQLASVFLRAHQRGLPGAAAVARATLDYLVRELTAPDGGFCSSQDADGPGGEGAYYTWTAAEWRAVLGERAELAALRYGVALDVPGSQTLRIAASPAAVAAASGRPVAGVEALLAAAQADLLAARARRQAPVRDDKVVAAWQGLALRALAAGYRVLGEPAYLAAAQRAGAFACRELVRDGRCHRSWWRGQPGPFGVLEDYALLALGLLDLAETDGDPRWLAAARCLLDSAVAECSATDGGFYQTPASTAALLVRSKSLVDGPIPAGAAALCLALLRAGHLGGDEGYLQRGRRGLAALHGAMQQTPRSATSALAALQFELAEPATVVVVGSSADPRTQALLAAAWARPATVVVPLHDEHRAALLAQAPWLADKEARGGVPTAYLCRGGVCREPTADPEALRR